MYCNQCGHKNPEEAKFCSKCGNKLEEIIEQEQPTTPPEIEEIVLEQAEFETLDSSEVAESHQAEDQAEPEQEVDPQFLQEYMTAREFGVLKGWPEDKIIEMVKDGFYSGKIHNGAWYVHRSETGSDTSTKYTPIHEFAKNRGLDEEEVIRRIKEGFYNGKLLQGKWVVEETGTTAGTKDYQYKDPTKLHKWTLIFIYIQIAVTAAGIFSTISELNLLQEIAQGQTFPNHVLEGNDNRQQVIARAELLVLFVTAIFILKWIYRANNNARALGAQGMEFTPGWSIGYYFIPIMNLWKPYSAMKEIWRASTQRADFKKLSVPFVFHLWWFFWIVAIIVDRLSFRLHMDAETLEELLQSDVIAIISGVLTIILSVIVINMFKLIYAVQEKNR